MSRSKRNALLCLLPVVTMVSACSLAGGGSSSDRRYDDLRGLVVEQRRAIEDLRREQESIRAAIDRLQYGNRRALGRPVYGPAGSADDSSWQRPTPVPADEVLGTTPPATTDGAVPAADGTAAAAAAATEPGTNGVPSDLVGSTYDSAQRQMGVGDYDEAIQSFRNFLHENGSSAYADDAQFWIGESYFRKGQYHRAIIEFNQVSINYGSGDRAPSALLRQAEAFRIVGDRVDARLSLQKIISRYPGTGEAAKASRMLTEIGG